jgi:hypothetical protein
MEFKFCSPFQNLTRRFCYANNLRHEGKVAFVTNFHLKLTMKMLDPRWHHVNHFLVDATVS